MKLRMGDLIFREVQWSKDIRRLEKYIIYTIHPIYYKCSVLDEEGRYNGMIDINKLKIGEDFLTKSQAKLKFPQYFI